MPCPAHPQAVTAPITRCATFLVLKAANSPSALGTIRSTLAGINGLSRSVSFRDIGAPIACTVGIGSDVWDSLTGLPRPPELHPFVPIKGRKHEAISTPGDLLFHIRSDRRDLCFEFERQLMVNLGSAVSVVDETVGFRYFDARDLLGFVDGSANPGGEESDEAAFVSGNGDAGSTDKARAEAAEGGSYVVVQKYLHDIKGWEDLPTETQESIIGHKKLDNMELDDAGPQDQKSHKTLATIEGDDGEELDVMRYNMPFGSFEKGEFGTYFIGYSGRLWVLEEMLKRMFVGVPEGKHDRILDFSRAVTGTVFFAPRKEILEGLE